MSQFRLKYYFQFPFLHHRLTLPQQEEHKLIYQGISSSLQALEWFRSLVMPYTVAGSKRKNQGLLLSHYHSRGAPHCFSGATKRTAEEKCTCAKWVWWKWACEWVTMVRTHSKADVGIKVLNINLSCNVTCTEYLDAYRRCRVGWLIGKGYIYIYKLHLLPGAPWGL